MKVVINKCYGGFGLSDEALALLNGLKGHQVYASSFLPDRMRLDKDLVAVVEKLGEKACGDYADLQIVSVNKPFRIVEYDGAERIETMDDIHFVPVEQGRS